MEETLRIGDHLLIARHRIWCGERSDDVGITAIQIPEIMQSAIRQDDKAAILRPRILASLFFADQRVPILRFGFEDYEWIALLVKKKKVDKTRLYFLEVLAEIVQVALFDRNAGFEADVRLCFAVWKEAPTCRFEQFIDLDTGGSFVHVCTLQYL